VDEATYEIVACEPPRRLRVRTANDYGTWDLRLDLEHHDGTTTLAFSQLLADPGQMEDFGPGWEWYLDRLVAVETGADPAAIDFARDYDPAMRAYYRALVPAGR
jgi:hypothetical protein